MAEYEKIAITLRTADKAFVDGQARAKSVGRSAVIRWALDYYRAFLVSNTSTCRSSADVEDKAINAPAEYDTAA